MAHSCGATIAGQGSASQARREGSSTDYGLFLGLDLLALATLGKKRRREEERGEKRRGEKRRGEKIREEERRGEER